MNVTFDPEADAIYITLRDANVAESSDIADGVILDRDEAGNVVGIEILRASQQAENPRSIGYTLAEKASAVER